jgi:hypothetical protein
MVEDGAAVALERATTNQWKHLLSWQSYDFTDKYYKKLVLMYTF